MVVVFAGAFALEKAIDKRIDNQNEIKKSRYRYYAKPYLMTTRENEFFKLLNDIFGAKWFVIPQVHLSSLLNHKVKGQNWNGAFRHINGKSVDYVLVGKESYKIICAIELDDSTHSRADRIERDNEINRIFHEAKIPLARIGKFENMSRQEIVGVITDDIKAK
jgi:hypothetical protein